MCPAGSVPHPAVQSSVAEPQRRCLSGLRKPIDKSRNGHFPCAISHFPFPTARQHGTWRTRCPAKTRGLVKVVDARVGVFAIKDGTRPPICILSLAILIPFGPCHLQHRLLQRTGASSRGTLQARTGSRSLPSGDFEIQERTFISSRPTTPIATPRGETMSEIRTMWRLLPC